MFDMSRHLLGGAGLAAIALALSVAPATAQQNLPRIEIGAARAGRSTVAPHHAERARPAPRTVAPPTAVAARPAPVAAPAPAPAAKFSLRDAPVTSSSSRSFSGAEVMARPFAQPAEALEIVPGLIVSQHSGSGKANQYFLRGFALDHGNDLALWIDGMPINMPSHAHGQGYADANFVIPEFFSSVDVRKGPFFADEGAFASAGAVHMQYVDKLRDGLFSITGGSFGWSRAVAGKSVAAGAGELMIGAEGNHYNGPWELAENTKKLSGFLRWSQGTQDNGLSLTAMAYSNHWNATEQIAQRSVDQGWMSRWGTEDPTNHGNAERYSLSARWSRADDDSFSRLEGYAIRNTLNLYSNGDYFRDNPALGDQFHHFDRRSIFGLNGLHGWKYRVADIPIETRVGVQGRWDDIRNGLEDTYQRNAFDQPRNDAITEGSLALWTDTTLRWTPWLRTSVGGRFDYWHVAVNSIQNPLGAPVMGDGSGGFCVAPSDPDNCIAWTGPFNSGSKNMTMGSPKAGLVLGPFKGAELFLNFGEGLQSSDGRATTIGLDPHNGTQWGDSGLIQKVPLLIKTRGAEAGVRSRGLVDGLDTTLTLFWQDFDSENLFEGDSGSTVNGRASRRYGFEWTGNYAVSSWARLDGEVTATHARFRGSDLVQQAAWLNAVTGGAAADPVYPANLPGNSPGNYLTNAPVIVATGGIDLGEKTGWFGGLRYRYFGSRPLTEDGQIKSLAAGTVNIRAGYRFDNGWKLQADAFNITNNRGDAIAYGYGSITKAEMFLFGHPGATTGVMDRHFKPIDPPAFRVTVSGPLSGASATPIASILQ